MTGRITLVVAAASEAAIADLQAMVGDHIELLPAAPRTHGLVTMALPDIAHGFVIDLPAHRARWCGRPLALRPNELRLLAMLAQHPDRLLTRSQLIAMLGKGCGGIDLRTVDVWIGRLRRALREQGAPDVVRTVRSLGYVFDTLAPAEIICS